MVFDTFIQIFICLNGSLVLKTDHLLITMTPRRHMDTIIIIIITQIYNARNVIITILKHHKMNLRRGIPWIVIQRLPLNPE